jgi:hypothetical protein
VSSTAIRTPAPVIPASHWAGAPTSIGVPRVWSTSRSSSAVTTSTGASHETNGSAATRRTVAGLAASANPSNERYRRSTRAERGQLGRVPVVVRLARHREERDLAGAVAGHEPRDPAVELELAGDEAGEIPAQLRRRRCGRGAPGRRRVRSQDDGERRGENGTRPRAERCATTSAFPRTVANGSGRRR